MQLCILSYQHAKRMPRSVRRASSQLVRERVWCGVVWFGLVWCGMVWFGVVWCGAVGRGCRTVRALRGNQLVHPVSCCPCRAAPPSSCGPKVFGTCIGGEDVASIKNVDSYGACCALCSANLQCVGFTYDAARGLCELKSRGPQETQWTFEEPQCISGIQGRPCKPADPGCLWCDPGPLDCVACQKGWVLNITQKVRRALPWPPRLVDGCVCVFYCRGVDKAMCNTITCQPPSC